MSIELQQVRKVFNQGKPNEFCAIHGIDLVIAGGRVTVLKGPSGSGKTTLLSLIGCLARPTAGRILLDGHMLSGLPERFLSDVRRRTFGFVFQRFNLVRGLTVLENVTLPAYPLGLPWKQLRGAADRLLNEFGLVDKSFNKAEWLSSGEAQRAAICRALINDPAIIIADEPTANLDSERSLEFMSVIQRLKQQGRSVVITSHDPIVCESPIADAIIEMRDGRMLRA